MLQAAGQLAGARHHHVLLLKIDARDDGERCPAPDRSNARNREAAFRAVILTSQLRHPWVDEVAELAVHVVREGGEARADLIGSEPGPAWLLDGIEEVVDEAG